MTSTVFQLRCNTAEKELWLRAAGGVSLSRWVKGVLNAAADGSLAGGREDVSSVLVGNGVEPVAVRPHRRSSSESQFSVGDPRRAVARLQKPVVRVKVGVCLQTGLVRSVCLCPECK